MSKPRLVFFDLDGTLIDNPSSEKLYLLWLFRQGKIKIPQLLKTVKFTGQWLTKFKREIFVKNKAYLYNFPITETIQAAQQFTFTQLLPRLRSHLVARLKQHQAHGDITILLTGAPYFIAQVFTTYLGIDQTEATEPHKQHNYFSDQPPSKHPFAQEKATLAEKICAQYNIKLCHTIAYANSIHDLALMEIVGSPIAVTPDRKLRHIALHKNWEIIEK